jgi:hypothetical protein
MYLLALQPRRRRDIRVASNVRFQGIADPWLHSECGSAARFTSALRAGFRYARYPSLRATLLPILRVRVMPALDIRRSSEGGLAGSLLEDRHPRDKYLSMTAWQFSSGRMISVRRTDRRFYLPRQLQGLLCHIEVKPFDHLSV